MQEPAEDPVVGDRVALRQPCLGRGVFGEQRVDMVAAVVDRGRGRLVDDPQPRRADPRADLSGQPVPVGVERLDRCGGHDLQVVRADRKHGERGDVAEEMGGGVPGGDPAVADRPGDVDGRAGHVALGGLEHGDVRVGQQLGLLRAQPTPRPGVAVGDQRRHHPLAHPVTRWSAQVDPVERHRHTPAARRVPPRDHRVRGTEVDPDPGRHRTSQRDVVAAGWNRPDRTDRDVHGEPVHQTGVQQLEERPGGRVGRLPAELGGHQVQVGRGGRGERPVGQYGHVRRAPGVDHRHRTVSGCREPRAARRDEQTGRVLAEPARRGGVDQRLGVEVAHPALAGLGARVDHGYRARAGQAHRAGPPGRPGRRPYRVAAPPRRAARARAAATIAAPTWHPRRSARPARKRQA